MEKEEEETGTSRPHPHSPLNSFSLSCIFPYTKTVKSSEGARMWGPKYFSLCVQLKGKKTFLHIRKTGLSKTDLRLILEIHVIPLSWNAIDGGEREGGGGEELNA